MNVIKPCFNNCFSKLELWSMRWLFDPWYKHVFFHCRFWWFLDHFLDHEINRTVSNNQTVQNAYISVTKYPQWFYSPEKLFLQKFMISESDIHSKLTVKLHNHRSSEEFHPNIHPLVVSRCLLFRFGFWVEFSTSRKQKASILKRNKAQETFFTFITT